MNLDPSPHPVLIGPEKLIRMAVEIADFFKSYPDERAAREIAEHINHFWTPKMREAFLAAAKEPEQRLSPLLMAASLKIKPRKFD
jgi:formate dehydrogenase subunit delta